MSDRALEELGSSQLAGGPQADKMTCRPYQHLSFSKAPQRPIFVCIWYSDNSGGQGRAFVPCSSLAVGNFADSKNLSYEFIAQAVNKDIFSF